MKKEDIEKMKEEINKEMWESAYKENMNFQAIVEKTIDKVMERLFIIDWVREKN
jgi:hypothetical protein